MLKLSSRDDGVTLEVRAQPGRQHDRIVGVHDGRLRISVTAPPEKGRANKALIRVLAQALGLRRSQLEIIQGRNSVQKVVRVDCLSESELSRRISAHLSDTA